MFSLVLFAQVAAELDLLAPVQRALEAIQKGDYSVAGLAIGVAAVAALRFYGPKVHEWLPDNLIWDKPLTFLFDTTLGGWVLNFLSAISAALVASGFKFSVGMLSGALTLSFGMAGVHKALKDAKEAQAAKAQAAANPFVPVNDVPTNPGPK